MFIYCNNVKHFLVIWEVKYYWVIWATIHSYKIMVSLMVDYILPFNEVAKLKTFQTKIIFPFSIITMK
jgi:hypothetical protein